APMPWILWGDGVGGWPARAWLITGLFAGSTANRQDRLALGVLDVAGNSGEHGAWVGRKQTSPRTLPLANRTVRNQPHKRWICRVCSSRATSAIGVSGDTVTGSATIASRRRRSMHLSHGQASVICFSQPRTKRPQGGQGLPQCVAIPPLGACRGAQNDR